MDSYKVFASVYDLFMGDIDYEGWVNYLEGILNKNGLEPKLIAELGCGTGNITRILANRGYDMIGIDISDEMLSIAREKNAQKEILYICQDMIEFELYGTVDLIISLCDSINYITCEDDLLKVFSLVNNYLNPGGLFIFDLNTEYRFKNVFADNTFTEMKDEAVYIWDNYYDINEKINEYFLTLFIKDNNDTDKYTRVDEVHYEKSYSISSIKKVIQKSGLEFIAAYDAFSFERPKDNSERIYVIAKEKGKFKV